jgi:hypothetical protein
MNYEWRRVMANKFVKLNLDTLAAGTVSPEIFESSDTSHECNPNTAGCMTFKDGMKVKVRRDKQGNLILEVIYPHGKI